ncbi:ABC transporter ATP-binding protein/permease [Omnitrophica bacterium]|nr:ABC transporter ATP-binding protein/permease [Candidatus Omnitrophota bacterium]
MRYLIEYFVQFRRLIGRKIYLLLSLMSVIGFVEGIGIALFLPILQNGFGDDRLSRALKFVFDLLRISFSFNLALIIIVIFFTLRSVLLIFYAGYFGKIYANLIVGLRYLLSNKIFTADYLYLLKKETGYINNIITREIPRVVSAFDMFSSVINYTLYGLIYMALAMLLNFRAAIVIAVCGPIVIIFVRKINPLINQASLELTSSYGRFHSILIQVLGKLKYLKATFSNTRISKIINKENKILGHIQFKLFFLQSFTKNAFEPLVIFVVVGLLFYYVTILRKGVSEVIFLAFLFMQVARQFLTTQTCYRKFLSCRGSIKTFNDITRELEENTECLNPEGVLPGFDKEIALKDVTSIFPNGKKALENINITVRPASVVALVGESGSGKSTIANLITGILKPTSGEVLFGNANYNEINLKHLRENIGYITQEDVIFNASIKDNISLWGEDIDNGRLKKAIEMAHINRFVKDLPKGEDELLGDNGLDVSGGQRQRITIARELYKDTKLLILDEATSSLDSKSERHIYDNLRQFKGTKTMLVIAHRLSTIKNADYIYVLHEGRVIEEGTYDQLTQRKGEFTRMINDQRLTENDTVKVDL